MALPPVSRFEETRKATYLRALRVCGDNMSEAARQLGVSYVAYRDALIEWGAVRPRRRTS